MVTLEMRFDELGEYGNEIWKVLVLLRENRFELKQNAAELREDRKMKKNLLFIRAAERVRRRLIYARKCLQARLELLERDNEEKRQEVLGLHAWSITQKKVPAGGVSERRRNGAQPPLTMEDFGSLKKALDSKTSLTAVQFFTVAFGGPIVMLFFGFLGIFFIGEFWGSIFASVLSALAIVGMVGEMRGSNLRNHVKRESEVEGEANRKHPCRDIDLTREPQPISI